jgi:serine/threonine protein kinase
MRIPHSNVVAFYQALRTNNNVYMFLELCDYGDLKKFIKRWCTTQKRKRDVLVESEAKYVLRNLV